MAQFLTAKQISEVAVPLLARRMVLPQTVTMIPGGEYAGSNGDTVTVRVRGTQEGKIQDNPGDEIDLNESDETPVDVQIHHIYDARRITDEDLTLKLEDFAVQVTEPQVDAIKRKAEKQLAAEMNGLAADIDDIDGDNEDDVVEALLEAAKRLSDEDVPEDQRYIAHGTGIRTKLHKIEPFYFANASGDDETLRENITGRLFGFTFVQSPALNTWEATAYHSSGFAWANRVPRRDDADAVDTAMHETDGLGARQLMQWIPQRLSKYSVLETYAGAKVVDEDRVVKLAFTEPA